MKKNKITLYNAMDKIIKSFNIFVDTDRGEHTGTCTADNIELNLNHVNINTSKGQFMRLTLQNFSMFKNWTNVNTYNSKFRIFIDDGGYSTNIDASINLDHKDYTNREDLANNLANKVLEKLRATKAQNATIVANSVRPIASISSDKIISFQIDLGANHDVSKCSLLFPSEFSNDTTISDAASLLGAKRAIGDETSADDSRAVDTSISNDILTFTFPYPCQLQTEQFVYLRTNLMNNTIENSSLGRIRKNIGDTHHSNILGRFTIVSDDFVQFDAQQGREYFIDLDQKHLQNIKLRLTTSHDQVLPFIEDQNTLGNLNFTCVIRCDVIQRFSPEANQFEKNHHIHQPRFDNLHIQYDGLNR